jgi:hypothetical protein
VLLGDGRRVVLGLPVLAVGVCLLVVSLATRARRYTAGHAESGGVS